MSSELQCDSIAQLRDTEHEPCQCDVHLSITSMHRFPATFCDDSGAGRAVMVPVALPEQTLGFFSVRLCRSTIPQRAAKSHKDIYYTALDGLTRLEVVRHGAGP